MIGNPRRTTPRTSFRTRTLTHRSLVVLSLATALALAGCSKSSDSPADGPDSQNTAAGSTLSVQWPLTGLTAKGALPERPVMIVKIDNTDSSSPQIGLSKADLVTEELVEGGSTRLAAFFHSRVPKVVGPVRSFRATDIGIVEPAEAVLVASGGAPPTVSRMAAAKIRTFTEGATGFYRDNNRVAPYNLFMDLPKLASTLKPQAAPGNYLPWGAEGKFPAGQKAGSIAAVFSAGHTTSWEFKGGEYTNTNTFAAEGDDFRPDTVLVLRVQVGDAGYTDPAGNPVPETHFTGKGQAMVFHGGKVVRGTWVKKGFNGTVGLRTKSGKLALPSGNVWIELVPANGGNVTFSK